MRLVGASFVERNEQTNDDFDVVLDEATAHLDTISEQRIRSHLRALSRKRVVILITHRLSTVAHADAIIVLGNGGIEAMGGHRELLRKSETYRRLWQAQ